MAKIKLSETIHFSPAIKDEHNSSSGEDSILKISVHLTSFKPGETVLASVHCSFSDNDLHETSPLDYLAVSLEGRIIVDGHSTSFVHAAEIEHGRTIRNGTHFTQPVSIRIPSEAIACDTDVKWKLSARAGWKNTSFIQDQIEINVHPAHKS